MNQVDVNGLRKSAKWRSVLMALNNLAIGFAVR